MFSERQGGTGSRETPLLVTAANQILSMTQKLQTFRHQRVCSSVLVQTESKSWSSGASLSTGAQSRLQTGSDFGCKEFVFTRQVRRLKSNLQQAPPAALTQEAKLTEHLHRCARLTNQRHSQT